MPPHAQAQVRGDFWAIFDLPDGTAPGDAAVAEAVRRARAFSAKWAKLYPSAVECLNDDFAHLVSYLRFPAEHWGRIRHSNFIERTFGETRRRVKVIGRFPGERSCLSLAWAVLDRASRGWRGVQQTIPHPPARRASQGAVRHRTHHRRSGRRGTCRTRRVG